MYDSTLAISESFISRPCVFFNQYPEFISVDHILVIYNFDTNEAFQKVREDMPKILSALFDVMLMIHWHFFNETFPHVRNRIEWK